MREIVMSTKLKILLYILIAINIGVSVYITMFVGTANTLIDNFCDIVVILLLILQVIRSFSKILNN